MNPPARWDQQTGGLPLVDKASLSEVRRRLRGDLKAAGVDPSLIFDCLVAITEAGSNALLHGSHFDRIPLVSWDIGDDAVFMRVQDFSGRKWSQTAHPSRPDPLLSLATTEHRVGGFGIDLMRSLMDDVQIESGAGGTSVLLTKAFRPPFTS